MAKKQLMEDNDMNLNMNDDKICPNCGIELENDSCLECGFLSDELEEDGLEENGFNTYEE
ncbi:hypothetical protein HZB04_00510 [Candidatus Wolfebacteria bacterium]|nr:hypothetical protein [Candidatus Wolfebacteria bacterium]